jgi:hypothetical protein
VNGCVRFVVALATDLFCSSKIPFLSFHKGYYVITIIIVVISVLITVFHKQIVYKLQGPTTKIKE